MSPREYNFTTDRIFIKLPAKEIRRIHKATEPEVLAEVAAEEFTSRSGFISFYSPDVESWGPLKTWDHNQRYCLLTAYARQEEPGFAEASLVEDYNCNGDIDNWLLNTPGAVRGTNLAYRIRCMRGQA